MRIFRKFFHSTPISVDQLIHSLDSSSTSRKIDSVRKFLKANTVLTKEEALKIQEKLQVLPIQESSSSSTQNTLLKKISYIFFKIFPSQSATLDTLKSEIVSLCSQAVTREDKILKMVQTTLGVQELSENSLENFKRSLNNEEDFANYSPSEKALFAKALIEQIIVKTRSMDTCSAYVKSLSTFIDSIDPDKKDFYTEKLVATLKEFQRDIPKIEQSAPINLTHLAQNPLSSLYFAKNALHVGQSHHLLTLQKIKEFEFLGEDLSKLESQISILEKVKVLASSPLDTTLEKLKLLTVGIGLLKEEEKTFSQIVTQETIQLIKSSKGFSATLLQDIESLIKKDANKEEIAQKIEMLLGQDPSSLEGLDISKIEGFIKNVNWKEIQTDFNKLPKTVSFYVKAKLLEVQGTYFSDAKLEKIRNLIYDELKIKNPSELRFFITTNKLLTESRQNDFELIYFDFNSKEKRIEISSTKALAQGQLAVVYPFQSDHIVKVSNSHPEEADNANNLCRLMHDKNPEGILPFEKIEADHLLTFPSQEGEPPLFTPVDPATSKVTLYIQKRCKSSLEAVKVHENNKKQIVQFSKNLATALSTAHQLNIVHGDIKEGNALTNGDQAYLIDWEGGLQIDNPEKLPLYLDYTNGYAIEEEIKACKDKALQFKKTKSAELAQDYLALRKQIDIFELGVTFYKIASEGTFPYDLSKGKQGTDTADFEVLMKPDVAFNATQDLQKVYSKAQADMIVRMLDPDPTKRPSAGDVVAVFTQIQS